jgi:hypothetical protein
MVTPSPEKIASLKAKIAAKYQVYQWDQGDFSVFDKGFEPISGNCHDDPLDAEAEMEAIIQTDLEAELEAQDDGDPDNS